MVVETEPNLVGNWYQVSRLSNGVVAIGEPNHSEEVYSYLVLGNQGNLLIDTGMGIVPITSVLEMFPQKPLTVVNTHWHFDHVGGNHLFKKVLVPQNKLEVEGLKRGWSPDDLARYNFAQGFKGVDGTDTTPPDFEPEKFSIPPSQNIEPVLKDGYQIDLGDRQITVLETPGHTPGGICLFETILGLLFTGDLIYEGPLYAFEEESDPKTYLKSLKKVKKTVGDRFVSIHPGHNYPENSREPNLLKDALHLFEMANKKATPDGKSSDFPDVVEYKYPGSSRRDGSPRRLKVLVHA